MRGAGHRLLTLSRRGSAAPACAGVGRPPRDRPDVSPRGLRVRARDRSRPSVLRLGCAGIRRGIGVPIVCARFGCAVHRSTDGARMLRLRPLLLIACSGDLGTGADPPPRTGSGYRIRRDIRVIWV